MIYSRVRFNSKDQSYVKIMFLTGVSFRRNVGKLNIITCR